MTVDWCVETREGGGWVIFDVFITQGDAQVAAVQLRRHGLPVRVVGRPVPPERVSF